jgi:hypothetical protein
MVFLSLAVGNLPAQEPAPAGPDPALTPLYVCPPRYSTPIVVPAEEVLQAAEQLQPLTDEGWIVQRRPVADCTNLVGDAESRAYQYFEFPLQLRRYESQIRMAEAELQSWQRRLENYKYFNKAGGLFVTVENTELAVKAAERRLKDLRYERQLFFRLHNIEHQLRQGVPVGSM